MSNITIFWIVLAAVIAVLLALGQYYFGKRQSQWWLYSLLRAVTYFCIFLLLINPKIRQQSFSIDKPSLVIAVDNSRSIKEFEEDDAVRDFIEFFKKDQAIQQKFEVDFYSFGEEFKRMDSLSFNENQTHISEAFSNLQKLYKAKTAPTLLLTDGNQTMGRDYEFKAKDYPQTLYPVVVGDTASYADVRVDRLNTNRYAFLNNKFPVEVFLNYEGEKSVQLLFTIKENNHTLYSETVSFDPQNNAKILTAELEAQSVGVHTYRASIQALENEQNTHNNQQPFAVEVIDQKTNVLLLSDFPHPDLGALKKSIETNQQRQADIRYTQDTEIDFGDYQLVVLFQPKTSFADAVKKIDQLKLNTFTITGTQTDYQFLNSSQAYIHKARSSQTEEYLPVYNNNFTAYQFEDLGFDDYPPLLDKFGDIKLTAEHQILLFQSIEGFKSDTPLLSVLEDAEQKHGFLFGENLWQWRAKSYRDSDNFEKFDDFTGKLIQYLASSKRRERLNLDFKSFYNSGETIILQAYYFDEAYQFDPRAKISAQVQNTETKTTQEFPFLLKNNSYELNLSNLEAGTYQFTVIAEGKNLSKSGQFTIIDFDIEKQFLNANVQKLKSITDESLYFPNQAKELAAALVASDDYKPIQKSKTTVAPLVDWWYLLFIIAVSLAIEWFMRKYKGLI